MPQTVPCDHHSEEGIIISQHSGGRLNVSGREGLADLGRADHYASRNRNTVRPDDIQSGFHGHLFDLVRTQQVAADPVVITDQHSLAAETADDIFLEILFRGEAAERPCEGQDFHMVHTEALEDPCFLLEGCQQAEIAGVVLEHIAGMGPEGDDHAFVTPVPGCPDKPVYHKTVSKMDTVEKACCYNHLTSSKS